jgi:hypothetical protein
MNLYYLSRQIADYSFMIRFFSVSGRLVERLRCYIYDVLKEKLKADDMRWPIFFSQVQECTGWESFINKLLDEVG